MGNILEVNNLFFGYSRTPVVKDLNFNIEKGSFVAIAGPNGSGKTTLFRLITGFHKPARGEIIYNSKNIFQMTRKEIAREIAVLPQLFYITFPYSVIEFVTMGRYPHLKTFHGPLKIDIEIAEKSLNNAGINYLKHRKVSELSGGELQKVLVAQALAQQPKLFLLDEPTSHLDINHQIEILNLLNKLNKETNLTIIIILHDLNLIGEYCSEVMLMKDGEIYQKGKPETVLTYQNIEYVFNTVVVVQESPVSKKPHVFLVKK